MDTALWVVQGILGLVFAAAGVMKLMQSKEALVERQEWAEEFTPSVLKTIGVLEVLAVIGLIYPGVTGSLGWLTPAAALGLMLLMAGAAYTHNRREEKKMLALNVVLFVLALFVVWGRLLIEPI